VSEHAPGRETAASQNRQRRWLWAACLGALGVGLLWLMITKSLVAYLAEAHPRIAIAIHPSDSAALLKLADRRLDTLLDALASKAAPATSGDGRPAADPPPAPSPEASSATASNANPELSGDDRGELAEIERMTRLALTDDPLNAQATRILGQVAELNSDEKQAARYMRAAAGLSLHETYAVIWLMRKAFADKDYEGTVHWAEAILQTRSQSNAIVLPILARVAEDETARGYLDTLIKSDPPWRAQFFAYLSQYISDARTPLRLLLLLKDTAKPPTTQELHYYLDFLIAHKLYDVAYYTWLQFLPTEDLAKVGFVFNGDFAGEPIGLPFDWVIGAGSGVTAEILPMPTQSDRRALYVAFGLGRVEFPNVSELMLLAPGRYKLVGKVEGEIVGRRGLSWRVACAEGGAQPAGESPMLLGKMASSTTFEADITVPDTDCRAQYLRLEFDARSASEQFVSGSVWFSDLAITRAKEPAQAEDAPRQPDDR